MKIAKFTKQCLLLNYIGFVFSLFCIFLYVFGFSLLYSRCKFVRNTAKNFHILFIQMNISVSFNELLAFEN